jgi:uncharacterized protein YdeI (YjbR/CyaY-like superfamily)
MRDLRHVGPEYANIYLAGDTFVHQFDTRNRFVILYRIHEAEKPETRARRLAKRVAMLAHGDTIH